MSTTKVWVSVRQRAADCDLDNSTIWRHVRKGLLPAPVRLTAGTTRFPRRELDAVDRARLAGATDNDIRTLVKELAAARQQQAAA